MKANRGSAIVETVAAAGVAAVLMSASLSLGHLALDRRRGQATSRYAAQLAASGLSPEAVSSEVANYAGRLGLASADLSTRRYLDIPSAAFYRLMAAETQFSAPRPPALGGGEWTWTETSVLEEE